MSEQIWYFLTTGNPCGPHRMALNHTDLIKINIEIHLECHWKPHKSIIFNVICDDTKYLI